jgi:hypothetical protein
MRKIPILQKKMRKRVYSKDTEIRSITTYTRIGKRNPIIVGYPLDSIRLFTHSSDSRY